MIQTSVSSGRIQFLDNTLTIWDEIKLIEREMQKNHTFDEMYMRVDIRIQELGGKLNSSTSNDIGKWLNRNNHYFSHVKGSKIPTGAFYALFFPLSTNLLPLHYRMQPIKNFVICNVM